MGLDSFRKTVGLLAALVTVFGIAVWGLSGATAPDTAPNVTFTAAGTFAAPQISGNDTLKLAGEPFSISIVASAGSAPVKHGPNWALFSPLNMTGEVHSGLLGPTPVDIASSGASIYQAVGPSYDPFQTGFPVKVVGISLTINAEITLPAGTLVKPLIHPFAAVALAPANTTVIYSNGTDSTTLAIASGTLVATLPTGGSRMRMQ
jgi:hypothetical protein